MWPRLPDGQVSGKTLFIKLVYKDIHKAKGVD